MKSLLAFLISNLCAKRLPFVSTAVSKHHFTRLQVVAVTAEQEFHLQAPKEGAGCKPFGNWTWSKPTPLRHCTIPCSTGRVAGKKVEALLQSQPSAEAVCGVRAGEAAAPWRSQQPPPVPWLLFAHLPLSTLHRRARADVCTAQGEAFQASNDQKGIKWLSKHKSKGWSLRSAFQGHCKDF